MTDFEWLKIIAVTTPIFILCVALLMIPLTSWQDKREARRQAERAAEGRQSSSPA